MKAAEGAAATTGSETPAPRRPRRGSSRPSQPAGATGAIGNATGQAKPPPAPRPEAHRPGLAGAGPVLGFSKMFEAGPVTLGADGSMGAQFAVASVAHVRGAAQLQELRDLLAGLSTHAPVMLHMDTRSKVGACHGQ